MKYLVDNIYKKMDDYVELTIIRKDKKIAKTIFDLKDYDFVSKYRWTFKIEENYGIRIRCTSSVEGYQGRDLSTILLNGEPDKPVDHINRDTLDNRRKNLRKVTRSINSTNARVRSDKKQKELPRGIIYIPDNPEPRKDGRGQKRYANFQVQWSNNGTRKTKTFSVKKLGGYDKALEEAIKFRENKLKEMKI